MTRKVYSNKLMKADFNAYVSYPVRYIFKLNFQLITLGI